MTPSHILTLFSCLHFPNCKAKNCWLQFSTHVRKVYFHSHH